MLTRTTLPSFACSMTPSTTQEPVAVAVVVVVVVVVMAAIRLRHRPLPPRTAAVRPSAPGSPRWPSATTTAMTSPAGLRQAAPSSVTRGGTSSALPTVAIAPALNEPVGPRTAHQRGPSARDTEAWAQRETRAHTEDTVLQSRHLAGATRTRARVCRPPSTRHAGGGAERPCPLLQLETPRLTPHPPRRRPSSPLLAHRRRQPSRAHDRGSRAASSPPTTPRSPTGMAAPRWSVRRGSAHRR